MRIILIVLFLLKSILANCQSNFTSIDTTSSISCRTSLNTEYKQKFITINKNISSVSSAQKSIIKGIYNEIQDDFLEKINKNNFICDDQLNLYLQDLIQEVLNQNAIKEPYRILLSKDSEANAYNTGDGTVVINFGLFLTLENEDELVFVISHEIGHQYLSHVKNEIETFAKLSTSEAIIKKTKEIYSQKYGKATMATDLLKSISYQNYTVRRKKEFEADAIGLNLYKKTLRNPKAAVTILEKLDDSDSEKDSLTIADYKSIFEKNDFKVKKNWFEQEESLFKKYDKEKRINIDSLKTHPSCIARIKMIKDNCNNTFPEKFTNSNRFSTIKASSIYQNLIDLYATRQYGFSLYEALKLYKKDSDNIILKNIIYLNLVKIQASRISYTINRYVPSIDNKHNTESLNRFISFINNIKMSDFENIINNFKS